MFNLFSLFQYDFMIRALVTGLLIGIVAPLMGMFLVLKRYSLMADTLSHVSLVGIALSLLLHLNPLVGALIVSVLASIGIESLRSVGKIVGESVLALFLSGSLAIAIILISLSKSRSINLTGYLFGSITTITSQELIIVAVCSIMVFISIVLLYKQLFLSTFNEDLASVSGLPVKKINLFLTILSAITIAIAIRIVGILLVSALVVIPVITAMEYGKGFLKTTILSVLFSVLSVIVGLIFSFYFDLPSGGVIVLVLLGCFIASFIWNRVNRD